MCSTMAVADWCPHIIHGLHQYSFDVEEDAYIGCTHHHATEHCRHIYKTNLPASFAHPRFCYSFLHGVCKRGQPFTNTCIYMYDTYNLAAKPVKGILCR